MSKKAKAILVTAISLILNACAGALSIVTMAGTTTWNAASINLGTTFNILEGTAINIFCILLFLASIIIKRKFEPVKDLLSLFISLNFGMLVNFFLVYVFGGLTFNNVIVANIVCAFSIVVICMTISVYLKSNVVLIIFDMFLDTLKKYIFKGNVVYASLFSSLLSLSIAIIFGIINSNIQAISFITIFSAFLLGPIIQFFDKNMTFIDRFLELEEN